MPLSFLFLVVALVLWALASFGVGGRFNLIAAGLFFFGLTFLKL